jgi:glycosyltransferase involved in cell wall biosynthesis
MPDEILKRMRLTIQLCTYKRPHLLERVLEACFEQTIAPDSYEVVLVNDGSPDDTPAVIERLRPLARCAFTVVHQANAGLAKARNAGLARSRGERIAFIDDDVLPTPVFVEEHLRSDTREGDVIVRGAVINTASFDRLPPPVWSLANYSANYFWTSNVSVRRSRLDRAGGTFDDSFAEYGWEDIELGMRLRELGTRAVLNKHAVAFHFKPPPQGVNVAGVLRQVRAQARTAVQLERKHPHWRVALAVGDTPPQRWLGAAVARSGIGRLEPLLARAAGDRRLNLAQRAAVGLLATQAYYAELLRARAAH